MADRNRETVSSLKEREKELTCLYAIARDLTSPATPIASCIASVYRNLPGAFQFPSALTVFIASRYGSSGEPPPTGAPALTALSEIKGRDAIRLVAWYPAGSRKDFLDRELDLLNTLALFLANAIALRLAENESREQAAALRERNRELERKNIALQEVLSALEIEKHRLGGRLKAEIARNIIPRFKRLEHQLFGRKRETPAQAADNRFLWNGLLRAVKELAFPRERLEIDPLTGLSPREAEICDLIRGGMTSKEIAGALRITTATVERHRFEIRKKLGIGKRPINLTTFLRSPRKI